MVRSINTNDSSVNLQRLSSKLRPDNEAVDNRRLDQDDAATRTASDRLSLSLADKDTVRTSNETRATDRPRPALHDAGRAQELASLTHKQITAHPELALLAQANVSQQSALSVLQ